MKRLLGLLAFVLMVSAGTASAAPIMWVHDGSGNLGKVDVASGNVTLIGNMGTVLTDIAFDGSGNLYGVGFSDFWSIDTTTAAASFIGSLGGPNGMNALVFATDGTLYGAANNSTNLYSIDTGSGLATSLGSMGAASGGDLAFNGGTLYMATNTNELYAINLSNLGASSSVGAFGVSSMFGLGTGDNGVLYGVAGTTIYTINTGTGAATNGVSFSGQGLGGAFGQSFESESVPEPASLFLLSSGLAGVAAYRRRRKARQE